MSSDYITRLRSELLRAGAEKPSWGRRLRVERGLRPLLAASAIALAVVAVALVLPAVEGDDNPTPPVSLLEPFGLRVPGGEAEQAAEVLRARVAAAEIADVKVSVRSSTRLTITAPAAARADVKALTAPGRLEIYDWERSLIGPPQLQPVTREEAERRAAGHPGARAVHAEGGGDRWVTLAGEPELTNADVARAGTGIDVVSREAIVTLDFTPQGQSAFEALTHRIAQRGRTAAVSGMSDDTEAFQHFAIVLDDRIVATPYINFRENPDGVDAAGGMQVSGGLTRASAREIAALLSAGPLPEGVAPE